MEKRFEKILKSIPDDFEELLKALGNKFRFKLGLLIFFNNPLSFAEIVKQFNKDSSYIYNHIKKLELAGIIQNFIRKSNESRKYSFYEITEYGKTILSQFIVDFNKYYKININSNNWNLFYKNTKSELDFFLKGIKNNFRFALFQFLKEKNKLSFTEILRSTNKSKGALASHLKKLEMGGIIQNYFKKTPNTEEYSYYEATNFGEKMISGIFNSYNNYYRGIKNKYDKRTEEKAYNSDYITAGCGNWALPNEKVLGWIKIHSNDVSKIEITPSRNIGRIDFFNHENIENDDGTYSIFINSSNFTYIPFKFYSQIPEGDNSSNFETISINTYDTNKNKVQEVNLKIEIIKPVVKLQVNKKEITKKQGFFEIEISIARGIETRIEGIEIGVENKNGNPINIKTLDKNLSEIQGKIPPEINFNKLIGEFNIVGKGVFVFNFRVIYFDKLKNEYHSKPQRIKIKNYRKFEGCLNYTYNYAEIAAKV
ncbi:MAG: hypothetical protein GF311_18145 [Candidatus Lokiarchaeota archaeon]|nr:hypothetical protein [Candidatus Lokiarchaeota archaeon]